MAYRYNRINWQNKPSVATPISAENLNQMDKGINDNDKAIGDLAQLNTSNKSSLVSAVNELNNNLVTINNRLNRFRSYTASDESYTSSTLTQQVEDFWANIELDTFGLIHITNISDQWLAFYFRSVDYWGRVYILPGGGLTSVKWGQASSAGVWTWY